MPKLRNWFHDLHFYFASDDNYCYCLQRLMMPLFGDENWAGLLRGARGDVGGGLPRPLLDRTLTIVLHSFFHIWKIEKKIKKKNSKKKKLRQSVMFILKASRSIPPQFFNGTICLLTPIDHQGVKSSKPNAMKVGVTLGNSRHEFSQTSDDWPVGF